MDSSAMDLDPKQPGLRQSLYTYKDANNCFLRWLRCQERIIASQQGTPASELKTIAEIFDTAQEVQARAIAVPGSVMDALSDAIKYRRKVAQIYEKVGQADVGHEIFIQGLEAIHTMLLPLKSNMVDYVDYAIKAEDDRWENFFGPLPVYNTQSSPRSSQGGEPNSGNGGNAIPPPTVSPTSSLPDSTTTDPIRFEWEETEMDRCSDILYFLIELGKVHNQLIGIWQQAAWGEAPIAMAAWFTSLVAYEIGRKHIPRLLHDLCGKLVADFREYEYQEIIRTIIRELDSDQDPDECIKSASRLYNTADVMTAYGRKLSNDSFQAPAVQGTPDASEEYPFELTDEPVMPAFSEERYMMIFDVLEAVKTSLPPNSRAIALVERRKDLSNEGIQLCEAFFDLAQRFFLQRGRPRLPQLYQVIAMDLFMLVEKAARKLGGRLGGPQCRSEAVRFAMDVQECVAEFRNPNTPLSRQCHEAWCRANEMYDAIQQYSREHRSGLYHESPWTMGCHVMELLLHATSFGQELCYRYAVLYSILHLYNAMRRLNSKELRIPENFELNKLSQMFSLEIFKGDPPHRRFLSAFRYIVYKSHDYSGTPTSEASKLEKGLLRVDVTGDRIFLSLTGQHLNIHSQDPIFLTRVYKNPVARACDCGDDDCAENKSKAGHYKIEKVRKEHARSTLSEYTAMARDAAAAELSEDSPSSRLNFLKLFQVYSKVLEEFGNSVKGRLKAEYTKQHLWTSHMEYGLELSRFAVEDTLELIDLNFNGTRKEQVFLRGNPLLQGAAKMFKDMKEGRKPEDAKLTRFLWNIV